MLSNTQTQSHSSGDVSKQSRALTGTVTKLIDNQFGFIDDSVFFQLSVVKGGDVQLHDKVYCECSYSEHLPFKWNASKVHLVQSNSRGGGGQTTPSAGQSPASQVATTYLQHRLQQQSREEPVNPLSGNASHNYYSSSVSSNPSYASQHAFDYSKAQQAVAAAQQLTTFYGGRNEGAGSFSQLQYTSTPGSAFVSSSLPFTQQIQQNLMSTQPRTTAAVQNNYKSSRWEREERNNRTDDRVRARDNDRTRQTERKRNDSRDRDEFGRDLRSGDKSKDKEREKEREREKIERERERRPKRSESPNSVSGVNRVVRRRYEPVNIPKLAILKNPLNVYDLKQRYSAGLHVPSDFKEVLVNTDFTLNINDIPKPITFRVIDNKDKKKESKKSDSKESKDKENKDNEKENKDNEKNETKEETNGNKAEVTEGDESSNKPEIKEKTPSLDLPISSKQSFKYGVKVLILSLPSISDIYERIFGSDFDAISSGNKSYFLHFNKLLSFLVSRNSNDGFSLIGGKFNPHIDGYLDESEEPNLIATAVRVVGEQTAMNLSNCRKWRLIATFVYNRDNSVNPMTTSLELTRVYMPDVWSAFDGIYEKLNINLENDNQIENVLTNDELENNTEVVVSSHMKDNNNTDCLPEEPVVVEASDPAMDLTTQLQPMESSVSIVDTNCDPFGAIDFTADPIVSSNPPVVVSSVATDPNATSTTDQDMESLLVNTSVASEDQSIKESDDSAVAVTVEKTVPSGDASELQQILSRINDMKVADLRSELEKRGVRLKGSLKKADLTTKLREVITQLLEDENVVSDDNKNDWWAQRILSKEGVVNEDINVDDVKQEDIVDEVALQSESAPEGKVADDDVVAVVADDVVAGNDQSIEQMVVDVAVADEEPQTVDKEEEQKATQNGTTKRKADQQKVSSNDAKKAKNGEVAQEVVIPTKVTDGCVYVTGGDNLTVITLHEALNHQRYDQFEMSVVSELIRESLIRHFSHYILSSLVQNHKNPKESKEPKTTPLSVNYVHLSFAFFDASHCGHILTEDLVKLMNNANFTLSRRAFGLLVNNDDKVIYRDLIEPKDLLPIKATKNGSKECSEESMAKTVKMYEKNGTIYDIEKLVEQSESDEVLKVRLNEELVSNQEKINQLNEYIGELEARQKKMTIATEKQNDEICSLKRDREVMKTKYESMRKEVESSVLAFNKVLEKEIE